LSTQLIIPITTSPVAALLAAAGVAQWLADTARDLNDGKLVLVQIRHVGHSIVVTAPIDVTPENAGRFYQPPLCRWILTSKNGPAPADLPVIDYEDERRHNTAYYEARKQLQKEGKSLRTLPDEERHTIEQNAPQDFWPVAALINQMGALSAYNKAIERWFSCKAVYADLVTITLMMCSGTPGAIEQAQEAWSKLAKRNGLEKSPLLSATQIVNPEQGKGANRAKADKLDIGGQESFWLIEYFKYAGLYHAALPRMVQGMKDRKTYVVIPSSQGIEIGWYAKVFRDFQQTLRASSSVKMDILAVLRYTDLIVKEWEGAQHSSGRRRSPADYVEGLAAILYKDLGSAYATMNVATINLPDWITWPNDADHAARIRDTVQSHVLLISALDEKKGEEEQLLREYRNFLSSRDPTLAAFFAFTNGYAGHVMAKLNRRQRVRRLTMDNLKEIIMTNESRRERDKLPPLSQIFENEGFRNIATAIRQSTVIQQYYKTEHDDNTYDVRYGLAAEFQRHARDNREFIQALDRFLTDFLKENARVMERNKNQKYRKRIPISLDDIAHVTKLVDIYGAPTVANMLIACGYARDPGDRDDTGTATSSDDTGIQQDDETEETPF
jgi:hypothetical protein